ncbi:MAG: toll/interleukin-1 receptor domain-containing protein [Roseiflexaceae bacterium]|nr:toll/interleukin-1 receptor domain-containing protein [Roseiflexaceae bacterium]
MLHPSKPVPVPATTSVFLSYSRQDRAFVHMLHDRLEQTQIVAWWDQEEQPGHDWTEQLLTWLEHADAVVVVVSRHSVTSFSVKNEVLLAQDYGRRIVPVLLEQARGGLWVLIRSLQWIDARDGRDPLPELLATLVHSTPVSPPHSPNLLEPPMRDQPNPPSASTTQAQITIVLPGDMRDFTPPEQSSLQQILARFANIRPEQITIVRIEAGSVHVTLQMPESIARWLVTLHERRVPLMELLDIRDVRNLQVISDAATLTVAPPKTVQPPRRAPHEDTWWQRIFGGYRGRLIGAGALLAVVLLVLLALPKPTTVVGSTPFVGVVASVQGALSVQRDGWRAPVLAAPGTALQNGDRLILDADAQAKIVCADARVVAVPHGNGGALCNSSTNTLVFGTSLFSIARSETDASVPQVIVPRATKLSSLTPTLRWTLVDATNYRIAVQQGATIVWQTTVTDTTTLVYPADVPPLERGTAYRVAVSANGGSTETTQGIGFTVLSASEAQQVTAEVERVRALGLDAPTTQFLLANLYATNDLNAEALELLDALAPGSQQAAVFQLQGDLLARIGLPHLALEPYTRALAIAQAANDRLGQALAYRSLGASSAAVGGAEQQARANYEQALRLYEEFGDAPMVADIQQRLADLP